MCEKFSLRQSESTAAQLMLLLVDLLRLSPESVVESMGQWYALSFPAHDFKKCNL